MIIEFTKSPALTFAIAQAESDPRGEAFAVMLRALRDGRIAGLISIVDHKDNWTPRQLRSSGPTIIIVGDDRGSGSKDASEWRSAMSLIAWSRSAIIHGTGGLPAHYEEAVYAAEVTGRCLFVETDSEHLESWINAVEPRQIPGLVYRPLPGGGPHPRPETKRGRAKMHS